MRTICYVNVLPDTTCRRRGHTMDGERAEKSVTSFKVSPVDTFLYYKPLLSLGKTPPRGQEPEAKMKRATVWGYGEPACTEPGPIN